jgi:sugar transferase (PEP-CTERM/EpsH1 system associated)
MPPAPADRRPLVVHLLFRFDTGGLENGVVNLLNHLPEGEFRHAVVALDSVVPAFAARVHRPDVEMIALHKPPGQTVWLYPRLYQLFRRLRPAIVHTRNLAALECQPAAWAAGVRGRIHGEHGRDVGDLDGSNPRYQRIRRLYRPFVQRYVALSRDLESYLTGPIAVPVARVQRICNGVDSERFRPAAGGRAPIAGCPFTDPALWLAGTVGRMQTVKNQPALARAFVAALRARPELAARLRLVLVGDGPLRAEAQAVLDAAGLAHLAWLPGERADVPDVMRGLDCFVLPSLAEGISNTILEAMSSGLPVLATAVGGNADLLAEGQTGRLVPAGDERALAEGLAALAVDPEGAAAMGRAGRLRVEREFSLQAMVAAYQALYTRLLAETSTTATRS